MNPLHPLTIPTYRQLFVAMVPVSYTHLTLPTM